MPSYSESFKEASSRNGSSGVLPKEFRERYPTLAEVLEGGGPVPEGQVPVPPATVNLFVEGVQLKFCIMPRYGNRIAFGCVQEPLDGFLSIERALSAGAFEWKLSKRRT